MSHKENVVYWKCENPKICVQSNCERREWVRTDDDDWDFYWASVWTVIQIFKPETGYRLGDNQIINHFPNHYELTRKVITDRFE